MSSFMNEVLPHREIEVNGERINYDLCTSESLEVAMKEQPEDLWKYVGSGKIYYYNGIRQESATLLHCFIYTKNKK